MCHMLIFAKNKNIYFLTFFQLFEHLKKIIPCTLTIEDRDIFFND